MARAEPRRGPAELHGRGRAEREELGLRDEVTVLQPLVVVLEQLVANERCHQLLVGRQAGGGDAAGLEPVRVVEQCQADRPAPRPAADEPRRPAAVDLGAVLPVAVLADDVAGVVDRIDAVVAQRHGAGRPARVERVERPHHGGGVAPAVAVLRGAVAEGGPAVEGAVARDQELVARAVELVRASVARRHAGAEHVVLADAEPARVGPTRAAGAGADVERPGVARLHLDVDDAVVPGDRADRHFVEVALAVQQALGLLDQARRERLPALEQQGAPDHVRVGARVQRIGPAEEKLVLLRIGRVEDVLGDDADLADARPGGFELGEGRRLVRRLIGSRCAARQQAQRERQQAEEEARKTHARSLARLEPRSSVGRAPRCA